MFDIVHTALSNERELIVCSFQQDFSKGEESCLQLIRNAHCLQNFPHTKIMVDGAKFNSHDSGGHIENSTFKMAPES